MFVSRSWKWFLYHYWSVKLVFTIHQLLEPILAVHQLLEPILAVICSRITANSAFRELIFSQRLPELMTATTWLRRATWRTSKLRATTMCLKRLELGPYPGFWLVVNWVSWENVLWPIFHRRSRLLRNWFARGQPSRIYLEAQKKISWLIKRSSRQVFNWTFKLYSLFHHQSFRVNSSYLFMSIANSKTLHQEVLMCDNLVYELLWIAKFVLSTDCWLLLKECLRGKWSI